MIIEEGCKLPVSGSWQSALAEHRGVLDASEALLPALESAVTALRTCIGSERKVLVCGNGGSHAHAQHFAAELVVRFQKTRAPLPALALGSNPAVATAVINDLNHQDLFVRETRALIAPGDILLGISTSGSSPNVCRALSAATERGAVTIGLTGEGGMNAYVDHEIRIPSRCTARIQEMHMLVLHWLCESLDA